MIEALKRQIKLAQVATALLVIFFLSMMLGSFQGMYDIHAKKVDKEAPASDWSEYRSVVPAIRENGKTVETYKFERGQQIGFVSYLEHKKDFNGIWYDHLQCAYGKSVRKLRTQVWTERVQAGVKMPTKIWNYSEEVPNEKETQCRMCGRLVITTELGAEKEIEYCSSWFEIIDPKNE